MSSNKNVIMWTNDRKLRECTNAMSLIYVSLFTQALRKADYSDFCIFAKFETCLIPYILYIGIYCFKIISRNLIHRIFCIYRIYRVKIKFLFPRKTHYDSNFNRIFNYDYGLQGLTFHYPKTKKNTLPYILAYKPTGV